MELYRQRGYDRTTTAEIAARAGVTERTFFRYFPDKREVLFHGESEMLAALTAAIVAAPEALGPLEVVLLSFRSFEKVIEDNRQFNEPRQQIIATTPALQERQAAKAGAMTAALASALQQRGVEEKLATLTARTAMAVFDHAAQSWFEDPSVGLGVHLERAHRTLLGLSASGATTAR